VDHGAKQHHLTWEKTKNVGLLTAVPDRQLLPAAAVYYLITWTKAVRVHTYRPLDVTKLCSSPHSVFMFPGRILP